jgi:hypothetical protein
MKVVVMTRSWVAACVVAAAAFAVLLGGCELFEPDEAPPGSTPVTVQSDDAGTTSDISEAQRQSDIDSCREQARAVVDQESSITADINSRDAQGAFWDSSPDLTRNMDEYESRQRYYRIVEECMRARGHAAEGETPQ